MGIKTDLDLQGGDLTNIHYRALVSRLEPGELPPAITMESQNAVTAGLQFVNVPLDSLDPILGDEDTAIDRVLILLNGATFENPVFIHCEHGQDRTGLIIALYRIEHDGWSAQRAYDEWVAFGHDELHKLFTDDLDTYFTKKSAELARARLQAALGVAL